jgi:Cu/Ag efflux pump CusA
LTEIICSKAQLGKLCLLVIQQRRINYCRCAINFFERSNVVIPQVRQADRVTPENLGNFNVRSSSGQMFPLSTVIKIDVKPEPNRLPQFNQMNAATISAVLKPGVTMGQAVSFMQAQKLSPGMTVDWLSDSRQYVQEGNRLIVTFGMALIVIFLVLAAQFESFRDPLVIMVTVPLAVCGALLPLYFGFTTLNIYAAFLPTADRGASNEIGATLDRLMANDQTRTLPTIAETENASTPNAGLDLIQSKVRTKRAPNLENQSDLGTTGAHHANTKPNENNGATIS